MADDGTRTPILFILLWARRFFPYMVFFAGAVLGSSAVIRILRANVQQEQLHELAWLGVSLLLYWLAFGLLERNERSWKIYQGVGAVLTGALGISLVIIYSPEFIRWLTFNSAHVIDEKSIPFFTTGLALIVWSFSLLANNGGACFLWQIAVLPIALYSFWWWKEQVKYAFEREQTHLIVLSALYFAVSMGALLLMAQLVYLRSRSKDKSNARKTWQNPRSFPSKYHELLARGRLCELFEAPCENPCPLPTSIVSKYQKRRIQYRLYPDILEPFEKAYAILVTPQKRELCKVANEILLAKEKQLGAKRYQEVEVYLWRTLWDRLQDGEYLGDPRKAIRDKNRLLKEINPPGER